MTDFVSQMTDAAASKNLRSARALGVSSCTDSDADAQNFVATMEPENPKVGADYTLKFSYDLSKEITGGKAIYKGTLNGFPIVNSENDLCEDLAGGDTPCPIAPGHIESISTGTIAANSPHGKYVATLTWVDQDGHQLLCTDVSFTV